MLKKIEVNNLIVQEILNFDVKNVRFIVNN